VTRGALDPAALPATTARITTVANAITLLRLLLVPAFVVLLFADGGHQTGWRVGAFAAFAVASLTDRMDGALARSRGEVTELGKVADPIADKALTGAALVGLSVLGALPWWVTVVILAREVGVTALRFVVLQHGVIPASRGGKWKTFVQGVAIGLYLLPLSGWSASLRWWVMLAALVVTLVTGVDYVLRANRLRAAAA
jgi:CDP-diacylglycerol--glycerol-3-phosphate 3-phosphatidyltransferase